MFKKSLSIFLGCSLLVSSAQAGWGDWSYKTKGHVRDGACVVGGLSLAALTAAGLSKLVPGFLSTPKGYTAYIALVGSLFALKLDEG
jgi:hypothetical protein